MKFLKILFILLIASNHLFAQKLPTNKWQYIQIDNNRTKWGDYDKPEWLRYFGTDAKDINKDGFLDIVAGRYVYLNPNGDMTGTWKRIDFGENLDGMLFIDADNDENPDIIAEALPNIYWLEATDKSLNSWKKIKIAEIKETDHVNGQGVKYVQIIDGGKPEILLNGGDGVYMIEVPVSNAEAGNWKKTQISGHETNDEGMTVGDVDGDGDTDIISSRNNGTGPKTYVWYANPAISKQKETKWKESLVGSINYWPDRVEVADFNGDGMLDVVGSEERYPGLKPDASMYWFEQQRDYGCNLFIRHTLKTTWSMNNLDVADFDKDGDTDIVTNEHKGSEFRTLLYTNNGKGEFTESIIDTGHEHHLGTQFFDMDNDGDLDLIGAAWDNWKPFHVLRNDATMNSINKAERTGSVKISESTDEGFTAFKIETSSATYFYQKEAGGISSMLDKDGTDWIAWKDMGKDEYPKSLAGDFRGIPNCVRNGTTHPGFTQCNSVQINTNTIESESKDGNWKYRFEFYDDYAKMTWLKVAGDKYWFLYEGPIDGFYDPKKQLWGNNKDGVRTDKPKLHIGEGVEDLWDFVYFGSTKGKETFYCTTAEDGDAIPDLVAFADNDFTKPTDGMMVFGFGRGKNNASHYTKPMSFYIGFVQENIQAKDLKDRIKSKIDVIRN